MLILSLSLSLLAAAPLQGPPEEDAPRGRATVYRVDLIETLDGEPIRNGTIVVRDGVIEKIGTALVLPERARMKDLRGGGSTLMPPLVLSHANHLQQDRRGRGRNSRYLAVDSLYLEDEDLEDLRELGVLLLGVDPPGTGIPGRTSVVASDAETPRPEAVVRDLHLKLTIDASSSAKDVLRKALKDADKAIEAESEARKAWEKERKEWEEKQKAKAKEEQEKKSGEKEKEEKGGDEKKRPPGQKGGDGEPPKKGEEEAEPPKEFVPPVIDPDLLPVVQWLRKERLVHIWVSTAGEWLHWKDVLGERELPFEVVISHGQSNTFAEIVEPLAEADVRLYCPARISFLPYTRIRYNLPAQLARAGAELVLYPSGSGIEGVRSLRVALADLVREGLERRAALEAVTVRPAAAMGQQDVVQPLKAGAPATFVVFDGDALDSTSRVQLLVRDGEVLYDRAREEGSR